MPEGHLEKIKKRLFQEVDKLSGKLTQASHDIHSHPELCFEERFAHDLLTNFLEEQGLEVQRNAYGLETAFEARAGSSGPQVAVLCEYDALADIGHGCGHNIIAAAGLGAGLAAAKIAEEMGGRVSILGTPAEEGGGGKVMMIERGAFKEIDAALMLHPAGLELTRMNCLAVRQLEAVFIGRPAHSAASPHKGKNALDAAVLAYSGVAALRQHILPEERIHGIFTQMGTQVNVVPHLVKMSWMIRATSKGALLELVPRVTACLEAGANATGCQLELSQNIPDYFEMLDNQPLLDLYIKNALQFGRTPLDPVEIGGSSLAGSTDMGNVSYEVPAIHPIIQVADGIPIHTEAFAECSISEEADRSMIEGAKIMAATIADYWASEETRKSAAESFEKQKAARFEAVGHIPAMDSHTT